MITGDLSQIRVVKDLLPNLFSTMKKLAEPGDVKDQMFSCVKT